MEKMIDGQAKQRLNEKMIEGQAKQRLNEKDKQ